MKTLIRRMANLAHWVTNDGLSQRLANLEHKLSRTDAIVDILLSETEYTFDSATGLNGQKGRKQIVDELFREFEFGDFVETGTFFGLTSGYVSVRYGVPVHSCEAVERHHQVSRRLLRRLSSVNLFHSDSRSFLRLLATKGLGFSHTTLFYLDAHWQDDLPLAEEMEIISSAWRDYVVVVDDFKVEGDPGYRYDDYGEGKALELKYLGPMIRSRDLEVYFPSMPSCEEDSKRRGCVVIAPKQIAPRLSKLSSLRRYELR